MQTVSLSQYREFIKNFEEKIYLEEQLAYERSKSIVDTVKKQGNSALLEYTRKFDGVSLNQLQVTEKEIELAFSLVTSEFIEIVKEAKENIEKFHRNQLQQDFILSEEDFYLGQKVLPIQRVGLYIPGGKAAYPSSVLMNGIPAILAGVKELVVFSPPGQNGFINPGVLVACQLLGISQIYKVGGAQAIGAMAFGTETISPVQKIVGPGNIYVTMAKKYVFGTVGIDMIAGPSEIMILADEKANPKYIAADLLSQAEHDENARCILATTCSSLANQVEKEILPMISSSPRKELLEKQYRSNQFCILVSDTEQLFQVANEIAPEHLEILITEPRQYLDKIQHAGSVFLGEFSPEPVGDYFAGTNHTLPTSGTAKFSSPLGVYDFVKKTSYLYYSKEKLEKEGKKIITFAQQEGLYAHANAISVRLKK